MKFVHHGDLFSVYEDVDRDGTWAIKVPVLVGRPSVRSAFNASATLGGVSTLWNLISRVNAYHHPDAKALLDNEAARIRATAGAWNHEVRSVGPVRVFGEDTYGLVTRWCSGQPLADMPRDQQRTLFPRMLPALWDALSVAVHGDLHAGNLIVDDKRFAVIDPGAMIASSSGPSGASSGARHLAFVTHADGYPLLPPFYAGLARRLGDAWRGFVDSLKVTTQYPPYPVGANTLGQDFDHPPALDVPKPAGIPLPADRLALGILYYRILTDRHPWPLAVERGPAWSELEVVDDSVTGQRLGDHCVAHPPPAPRSIDPDITPAEDALALALLDLAVTSRGELER